MRIAAGTILFLLLTTMFGSLFHMSLSMNMGMSMNEDGMTDCPFMAHEEVVCPMSLTDHMGAWRTVFLGVVPILIALISFAGTIAFVLHTSPHRHPPRQLSPPLSIRELIYTFNARAFQDLFARGILHPKLF